MARVLLAPLIPFVFLAKIAGRIARSRRDFAAFLYSLPVLTVFVIAWALGETWGYLAPLPTIPPQGRIAT